MPDESDIPPEVPGTRSAKEIGETVGAALDGCIKNTGLDMSIPTNARRFYRACFRDIARRLLPQGIGPQQFLGMSLEALFQEADRAQSQTAKSSATEAEQMLATLLANQSAKNGTKQ